MSIKTWWNFKKLQAACHYKTCTIPVPSLCTLLIQYTSAQAACHYKTCTIPVPSPCTLPIQYTFFLLYIEHAPLLSVVLHAILQIIFMFSFVISIVHCLLNTLLHIIKVYWFNKTAKYLLVLVDQVLFVCWPRSYMSYHGVSLLSGVFTVE